MTNEEQGARAGVERLTDREFAAGIFLIVLGWLTFWAAADLPFTSSQGLGSGTLPKCLAIMIILLGVGQCVAAWSARGARLARWNLRDIALILGSAVFFALTIRGYQIFGISIPALGLVVSGPITMIICGLAARDLRFSQLVVFSLAMTVVCTILFRFLLGLPIPVAPWALGY